MARRSGLGKGLGALIPQEATGDHDSALKEVPLTSLRPNPLQPRLQFDEEAMASLAASIRAVGVLQPVLVRESAPGEYELIAGERRWRAARRAGLQSIPVLVQESSEVHSLEKALVENLHREDLGALEEAAAFQQLVDNFGYTHEQVGTRVGKSRTAVTNTLRLLQLPAGVQRFVADAAISPGHARALLGTPDRSFQEKLAKRAVTEGLTVRAVEELVRQHAQGLAGEGPQETAGGARANGASQDPSPAGPPPRRQLPAPGVLELEELLSAHLNTRVKVDMSARRGRVVVEFATLEDLERIYKLMVGASSAP
ncbi:MAG TPA: ParB/RepB/Spo0J family partition protein [Acidimicrobiales bacterium]|nr:ParB/RepB/Spo0J family partition protein [Acidimicrobiales bacterium]